MAITLDGTNGIATSGVVTLDNNKWLQAKDSGGTARNVLSIDPYNGLNINSAGGGSAAPIVFKLNGTETARFHTSGGITFNGDTAAANALDDYEEGTWTPVAIGAATAGTTTYSAQTGRYTKIGNVVTATGYVVVTGMSGSGSLKLSLPFAMVNTDNIFGAAYTYNLDWPTTGSLVVFGLAGQAYCRIHVCQDNAADNAISVENATWEAGWTITYQTSA